MEKNYYVNVNKALILIMLCLSGMILFITESPQVQVLTFLMQYFLTVILMKVEFSNPMVWFLGALTIYSIGYPMLYIFGINTSRGFTGEPLRWCWIAYIVFVLFFDSDEVLSSEDSENAYEWINEKFYRYFIIISGLFVLLSVVMIRRSGYHNKGEIYSGGNIFVNLAFTLIYFVHTIYILLMQIHSRTGRKSKNRRLIVFVGAASVLLAMFSGERDILLRFMVITIFSLYLNKDVSKKGITMALVLLICAIPITGMFKYYFLTSEVRQVYSDYSIKTIVSALFTGEFESASKNLQMLANDRRNAIGALGGVSYLSDITRIIGYAPYSSLLWFNNRYYSGSRVGHGFTIVGEGLVNFGIFGIILNFIIIGAFLSYLYKRRYKNEMFTSVYILTIPIMIYSIRADFANILSPLFRQVLLPVFLFGLIVKRKERKYGE